MVLSHSEKTLGREVVERYIREIDQAMTLLPSSDQALPLSDNVAAVISHFLSMTMILQTDLGIVGICAELKRLANGADNAAEQIMRRATEADLSAQKERSIVSNI